MSAAPLAALALLSLLVAPAPPDARAQGTAAAPAPSLRLETAPRLELTIEELWREGEAAFEAGELDKAHLAFQDALSRDPGRARSWNYAGGVLFARGDLPAALEHFARAVELDPRDPRACNNLATAWERLGDFARAEELYLQAVRADPAYATTHLNLGLLYARRLGRPGAARAAWLRFLELEPQGPRADAARRELGALPGAPPPAP